MVVHFVTAVPWGDNAVARFFLLLPPTIVHRDAFWCGKRTRWQVLYAQTGSFSCLQKATLRASLWLAVAAAAKRPAPIWEVAGPLFLANKKQRVVNIVTDAWLATAGLRGG